VWDLKTALEAAGMTVTEAESTMVSSLNVAVTDAATAKLILRIMDELEEHDDVQDVFANFDMTEALLEEASQ